MGNVRHNLLLCVPLALVVACTGDDGAASASSTQASTSDTPSTSSASSTGSDTSGTSGTSTSGTATNSGSSGSSGSSSSTTGGGDTSSTTTTTTTTGDSDPSTTTGDSDPTTTTGGAIRSCDDLYPVFEAEVTAIRGCTEDAECGQVLMGTSCGCTRDWVARLDANTEAFYELVDLAGELECELPFISTCDCPATEGYRCTDGICGWNYI